MRNEESLSEEIGWMVCGNSGYHFLLRDPSLRVHKAKMLIFHLDANPLTGRKLSAAKNLDALLGAVCLSWGIILALGF